MLRTRPKDIWRFFANTRSYCPEFNPPLRYMLHRKWNLLGRIDTLFCPQKILDTYQLFVNERILELPFVHRVLDELALGSRVLEFGCANSRLSLELASRGFRVTGVDLRPCFLTHPNFTFRHGDFFDVDFSEAPFDVIVAISAVEHIGLGAYGEQKGEESSDR